MPTIRITLHITDAEGESISIPTYWDVTDVADLAAAQATMDGLVAVMQPLIGPAILSGEVQFPLTVGAPATADDGYSVWSGATLSFRNSDGIGDNIYLPGILQDKMNDKVVAAEDGDVTALIAAFSTATGVGTNSDRISSRGSGSLWNAYVRGKRATRKP